MRFTADSVVMFDDSNDFLVIFVGYLFTYYIYIYIYVYTRVEINI